MKVGEFFHECNTEHWAKLTDFVHSDALLQ